MVLLSDGNAGVEQRVVVEEEEVGGRKVGSGGSGGYRAVVKVAGV